MTDSDNGVSADVTMETNLDQAKRVLNEALTGTASKSKNSLINEALRALGRIEKETDKC